MRFVMGGGSSIQARINPADREGVPGRGERAAPSWGPVLSLSGRWLPSVAREKENSGCKAKRILARAPGDWLS